MKGSGHISNWGMTPAFALMGRPITRLQVHTQDTIHRLYKRTFYFNNVIWFQYTQILVLVCEKQFLQDTSPHGSNILHWKVLRRINLQDFNSTNFWWQVTTAAITITTTTTIYLFCESRRSSFNTESIMYCTPAFWISDLPGEKKFTMTYLILIKFMANI